MAAVQQGRVAVGGVEVVFDRCDARGAAAASGAGASEGGDILYLHGNTGSAQWWADVMEVPGWRVTAPDMPNFARSGALGSVAIDDYASAMIAFADAAGLENPVLVGHSFGGAVAMKMAVAAPDRWRALVLVDSAAPDGLLTPEEHYPIIESYRTNRAFMAQALGAVVPTLQDPARLEPLVDDAMSMQPECYVGHARELSHYSIVGATDACSELPVLVMVGDGDVLITADMAERTAAAFAASRLVTLDGVGHSVMVEAPARFLGELTGFVAGV